jgi:predicted kinase
MKTIILVAGDLAALKSTIATKLSKDLKIVLLSKDTIKEVLGETIGYQNRSENLKLSTATFELMLHLSLNVLDVNDFVILESNFKDFEMQRLNEFLLKHQLSKCSIFLTGDFNVLYHRYVERQKERHEVHQSTGLMSFETFLSSKRTFDLELYGENAILVDTTKFSEHDYLKIMNYIQDNLSISL